MKIAKRRRKRVFSRERSKGTDKKVRSGQALTTQEPSTKDRALTYAKLGLRILPMHTARDGQCSCSAAANCKSPGKHPVTLHGVNDATSDTATIQKWWSDHPKANIGIATGEVSGIVVLDIDPRHGGDQTLKALRKELGSLPKTVKTHTGGGGWHYIFAYPEGGIRGGNQFGPGIDVLSDGKIMIAPGSTHNSGQRYKFIKGRNFNDLKPSALPEKWHYHAISATSARGVTSSSATIREGDRNNALASFAGVLRRAGASIEVIRAALKEKNRLECSPTLSDGEVEEIAASIAKHPAGPGAEQADEAEKLLSLVLNTQFASGAHLMFGADGNYWHYSGSVWSVVKQEWVEGRILDAIQANPFGKKQGAASLLGQVKKLLQAKLAVKDDLMGFLADPPPVINCQNGELWIGPDGQIELRAHRPQSHLRHILNIAYDADAVCPEYDKALREIFSKADDPDDLCRHWHELTGYIAQPKRNTPLIAVLLGGGSNGKTALTSTLTRLLGAAQVHAQRVEELERNRFAMGSLYGKRLFLDDDVQAGARLPDGILKTISEAKEVTGENKYKAPFNFVVRTVPMLLCNNVPTLADVSHGMLRRLMVIPFDRTFSQKERDSTLFERIWANEMPGVLNRALEGYARLLKRGGRFRLPADVAASNAAWLAQANPLPAFIEQCCEIDPGCGEFVDKLYKAYREWAENAGFTRFQTQPSFVRNLEHLGYARKRSTAGKYKITGITLR